MRAPAIHSPAAEPARRSALPEPQAKLDRTGIVDRRPRAVAQRQLAEFIQSSPRVAAQAKRQAELFGPPVQRAGAASHAPERRIPHGLEEDESLQLKSDSGVTAATSPKTKPRPNRTGLPDRLKSGVEALSGIALDQVKVHYNSPQPAQLNALAYAQGSDIHVAPGQERHLPHEAWHVVQQAQGRVKPTMQMKEGVAVNDDAGLEHEADVMGARALRNLA